MRRRVLIVEDHDINRALLCHILEDEYETLEAEDGDVAMELLKEEHDTISAVILDLLMPKMNGLEVLEQMQSIPELAQIPVIVATGQDAQESEREALRIGAIEYIIKPYDAQIIKHRLRNTIKMREQAAIVNATRRDSLTGLLSRAAFFEHTKEMIHSKPPGTYVMACFDVERFKVINDQYGTRKGDEVLKRIAQVFAEGFGSEGAIISRVWADNFAVLYPKSFIDSDKIEEIRQKAALLDGSLLPITFSIGRYIVDDIHLDPSVMYDRAVLAKESVKGRFDQHIAFYKDSMRKQILDEQEIVSQMNHALKSKQFEVWYQPQFNHDSRALIGAEALVRWRHPERGLISPGLFIPIFERNGFVYEVDKFVWEQACIFLKEMKNSPLGIIPVSVNVSRYDLIREDLVSTIISLVKKYRIPVEMLRLEITESAFSYMGDRIISVVEDFKRHGFIVEIDDFGSGYSSLNTLKDVPADVLKLDMRFQEGKHNSERGGSIVESIVRMARWIGMAVIAEGVEEVEQADFLKSIGCYYIQGYLYSKPLPKEEYLKIIEDKEFTETILKMEKVKNYDNFSFWNPKSIDSLIFNSYVGGACVFEYQNGKVDILRMNDKYAQVLSGSESTYVDPMNIGWEHYMTAESRVSAYNAIEKAVNERCEVTDEMELVGFRKPGESAFFKTWLRLIARTGNRSMIYCLIEDITEEKTLRISEKKSEILMDTVLSNVASGITATVLNGKGVDFLFSNDQYYTMMKYTRKQFEKKTSDIYSLIHPDDRERVYERVNSLKPGDAPCVLEYRAVCRDRSIIKVRMMAVSLKYPGSDQNVQVSVMEDITDESRERDNQIELLENLPCGAGIFELSNKQLHGIYLNKRYWEMVGRLAEELSDRTLIDVVMMEDRSSLAIMLQNIVKYRTEQECEIHIRHKDGHYIPFLIRANLMKNKAGRSLLYATYTSIEENEITFRQMIPAALEMMMASSSDLTFVKDRVLNYVCASRAFAQMAGLENENDIIGKNDYDLFPKPMAEKFREDDTKVLDSGKALIDYIENLPSKDDSMRYSCTSKYLLRDSAGVILGIYGVGRDITEQKTANEKLDLMEHENRNRYEHEKQLRKTLMKNAVLYYQFNLTTNTVEEYENRCQNDDSENMKDELKGTDGSLIMDKILPEDRERVRDTIFADGLRKAFERGEREISIVYRRKIGEPVYRWVRTDVYILEKPENGDVIAFCYCSNIDDAWKSHMAIETILDEDIESVIYVNVKTGVGAIAHMLEKTNYNRLYDKFDFAKEIEKCCTTIVKEESREEFREFYQIKNLQDKLNTKKTVTLSYQIQDDAGMHLKVAKACYLDEIRDSIVITRRDVTSLYRKEQIHKKELEDAVNRANRANNAKSDFLSHMSHDIRTPLNAVLAFSNKELWEGADANKLREYLERINVSGEYLLGIVNDVLDMSRIEQNRIELNPEPYSLEDFRKTIQNVIGQQSQRRDITFTMDTEKVDSEVILVDRVRFNQIFINLLSNAVKFTRHGGHVELIIQELPSDEPGISRKRFIVQDNGIGMKEEFIPHAFESFNQEYRKEASERNNGTGLGLAIVKELVFLMGGTILLESEMNKGTRFTLEFSFEIKEEADTNRKRVEPSDYLALRGARILLAEDNEINTEIARALLEKEGCIVDRAENGKEACQMYRNSSKGYYRIILMDIRMPIMDGITATKEIRSMSRKDAKDIPIIAMTADAFQDDEKSAYIAGMNGHIAKPIDPHKLYRMCCSFLQK